MFFNRTAECSEEEESAVFNLHTFNCRPRQIEPYNRSKSVKGSQSCRGTFLVKVFLISPWETGETTQLSHISSSHHLIPNLLCWQAEAKQARGVLFSQSEPEVTVSISRHHIWESYSFVCLQNRSQRRDPRHAWGSHFQSIKLLNIEIWDLQTLTAEEGLEYYSVA